MQLLTTLCRLLLLPGWFGALPAQDQMAHEQHASRPIPARPFMLPLSEELIQGFAIEPYRLDPRARPYIVRLRNGGFLLGWPERAEGRIVVHGPQGQDDSVRPEEIETIE